MSPTRKSPAGVRARAIAISASEASSPATSAPRPAATLAAYPEPQAMSSKRVPWPDASPVEQRVVRPPRIRLHQVRPVGRPLAPGLARFNPAHPPHPSPRRATAILAAAATACHPDRARPHRQVFGQVSVGNVAPAAISRKPLDGTCILTTRQRAECPVRGAVEAARRTVQLPTISADTDRERSPALTTEGNRGVLSEPGAACGLEGQEVSDADNPQYLPFQRADAGAGTRRDTGAVRSAGRRVRASATRNRPRPGRS